MAITGFEAGAIASVEDGIAGVGDEHDRSRSADPMLDYTNVRYGASTGMPRA